MAEKKFNPNDPGAADSNVFGLPYAAAESELVLLPVPFEATVSYGSGTANGPAAILEASKQIDLYHPLLPKVWERKVAMADLPAALQKKSSDARKMAEQVIDAIAAGKRANRQLLSAVNTASEEMIGWVQQQSDKFLKKNKRVATVGGDHSTPLGLLKALAARHSFGILQIDAHCDLRKAYEGFEYSHASIMYNALKLPNIASLTQVGIRDYCDEEVQYIAKSNGRVKVFFDRDLQREKLEGETWKKLCKRILKTLPENVFISFDIDGLSPELCPHTGTPVPGGLSYAEASYLIELVAQERNIIGFDLNEVSPRDDEWDANVGARVLFQLCCATFISANRQEAE